MPDQEAKSLTLEEAKAECEIRRLRCLDAATNGYNPAAACAWQDAKAILNRVQPEPDEEGQAVLWLIREKGWAVSQEHGQWVRVTFTSDGFFDFHTIIPIDEVKKLRLGGQDA